jgi:hypothetical protein
MISTWRSTLEFDRAFDEAEGVQVLDLGARAERLLALGPHRHVGVAAELPSCMLPSQMPR